MGRAGAELSAVQMLYQVLYVEQKEYSVCSISTFQPAGIFFIFGGFGASKQPKKPVYIGFESIVFGFSLTWILTACVFWAGFHSVAVAGLELTM